MKNAALLVCLATLTLLFAAGASYAKLWDFSSGHSPHTTAHVDLIYKSKLANGSELKPGDYQVKVVSQGQQQATLDFFQNRQLVAETPARLVNLPNKVDRTEVDYNAAPGHTEEITGMEFSGWHRKIVMEDSSAGSQSSVNDQPQTTSSKESSTKPIQ